MYRLFSYFGVLLLLVCFLQMSAEQAVCGEKLSRTHPSSPLDDPPDKDSSGGNVGTWLASFFREHISAVDGDRCPSMPTCSSYSVQAFEKHGFFIGWIMTVDRLIHEGEEAGVSPLVHQNGVTRVLDPVENNDFWWYKGKDAHQ